MHLAAFCSAIILFAAVRGTLGAALSAPAKRATVCNGHAELCSRPYGNTTFLGSHDSYAFSSDPLALARDQEVDIPTQLGLGVRFLQAEGHLNDGVLHFCHTSCLLFDGGTVVDYLTTVKTWLDANPNEVLTLLFTNSDGLSVADVWAPAFVSAGVDSYIYVPPTNPLPRSEWPTLGDLIDSGKRVITFMDAFGTDGTSVDYILSEFTMLWEPPFDSTDPTFPCSVNRTSGPLSTEDHLNMLNHNLDVDVLGILISDPENAATTNGVASIIADANGCAPLAGGVAPNFVMLDFVNIGEGLQAVDQLNGLSS
jgi:hypothetical protein